MTTAAHRIVTLSVPVIAERVAALDWPRITDDLDAHGCATASSVLRPEECKALVETYSVEERFRRRIVMAQHGLRRGEYKYFAYPLPDVIAELRTALYPPLAAIANRWSESMGTPARYPSDHAAFLQRCHRAGQTRPTPLLLQYGEGDYTCLHQDLYGEHVLPLQVTVLLSAPGRDFTGDEFVVTEQRPRRQSRAEVVALDQGDGVIFPVSHRPVPGTRGTHRVNLRHGVSRVRSGHRQTLGIIFHDAQYTGPAGGAPRRRARLSPLGIPIARSSFRASPVDRQRLLRTLDEAWTALEASYAGLSHARLTEPGVTGDWSVKDIFSRT
jgi:uncharacterized protein